MKTFAEWLPLLAGLQELRIVECGLGCADAKALAAGLTGRSSLRVLRVSQR